MASTGSIGVGIVGYGLAGRSFHAPFIAAVDGLRVAAIATSRADRQRRCSPRASGGDGRRSRSTSCVDRADVEIVVVASPNRTHVPLGIRALEAGRHVVVDKPIATDVADAERLVDAARADADGSCRSITTAASTATS